MCQNGAHGNYKKVENLKLMGSSSFDIILAGEDADFQKGHYKSGNSALSGLDLQLPLFVMDVI